MKITRSVRMRGAAAPVGVLLAAVWTAFQSCALGQTPPEPPRSGAESASEDDAVIVVAQRRQEEIGDVPIQITAFTEQEILDAGINSTQDFLDLTPNVILDDSFSYLNTFVNIRGVAQINNADSPVAVVVDGVAQNNQRQLKMSLFDIRQIEVLKGPQGALYGRNASGGAIVISTNPPGSDYEGFASAAYASGGRVETAASVGGAIVEDRALFRLAGAYLSDDGRIDNVFLGETADYIDHDFSIRGRLTLVPAGWLQVDARASYNEFRAGALADSFVPSGDAGDYQAPSTNLRGKSDGEIFETSLKWDADLGFAVLTGVSGYADLREDNVGDIDFSNPVNNPAGAFGAGQLGQTSILDTQLTSQEIRLVSPGDAPVRWIVGGYYLDTDFRAPATLFFDLGGGLAQANDPSLVLLRQDFEEDRDTWSVFAQADVDITSRLTAGAALRYDEDKRVQSDLLSDFSRSASFDSLQPRFTLRYALRDDRMLYASFARGFRSGGFNAPGLPGFRTEIVDTAEAGVKARLADGRFSASGAFYYSFVDDFQFFFLDLMTGQNIANLESVHIYGFELETRYAPARGLDVYASAGTANSKIRDSSLFPGFTGNHTPKSTDYTFNAGAQWRTPLARGLQAFLRIDYARRGERFWQVDNLDIQEPVNLINLRAGVEGDGWGLYFTGENVAGEDYYTDFNPSNYSGLGYDIGFLGQPSRFGVEARARF